MRTDLKAIMRAVLDPPLGLSARPIQVRVVIIWIERQCDEECCRLRV